MSRNEILKTHYQEHDRIMGEWKKRGYQYPPPVFPSLPIELKDLTCGARTKATGRPCRRKDIYSNGRCKLHGGLSTGPKTDEGKRKVALNGFKKKQSP